MLASSLITNKFKNMKQTLGGNRLGAGHKMEVEMHNYQRSTHDMSYIMRTTSSAGTLVPFLNEVAMIGDTFDINLNVDVKTLPTIGPLFGSLKVQLDLFVTPIRLFQPILQNNTLRRGMTMNTIKLPQMTLTPPAMSLATIDDLDNSQINPSCILNYIGLRGIGIPNPAAPTQYRSFNALDLLTYWDIYKNYYANKQEEHGYVIHTSPQPPAHNVTNLTVDGNAISQSPAVSLQPIAYYSKIVLTTVGLPTQDDYDQVILTINDIRWGLSEIATLNDVAGNVSTFIVTKLGPAPGQIVKNWDYKAVTEITNTKIKLEKFNLADIDTMRENIMGAISNPAPFEIFGAGLYPYDYLSDTPSTLRSVMYSQEGLGIKTYQSDLFNNWLNTDWIDGVGGITDLSRVDTTSGSFTIDQLNLSTKVYDMYNRIAVTGGSIDDFYDAVYTENRYVRCEIPMYEGGLSKELIFQEVVSTADSAASSSNQPLGTLAGRGVMHSKHKGGRATIKIQEPSIVMGIFSLTPRIDYSQGNKWHLGLKTMDDFHKPALDGIGFQELITEQMAWWDTNQSNSGTWVQKSAGKQPAWINYMTNVNVVKGNFAITNNQGFMVLQRGYEPDITTIVGQATIKDLTTYIDPTHYNHIFAQTSLDSQNYWVQIGVDMEVRRLMSAKIMPNL